MHVRAASSASSNPLVDEEAHALPGDPGVAGLELSSAASESRRTARAPEPGRATPASATRRASALVVARHLLVGREPVRAHRAAAAVMDHASADDCSRGRRRHCTCRPSGSGRRASASRYCWSRASRRSPPRPFARREEVEHGVAGGVGDRIGGDRDALESRLQRRVGFELQSERNVNQHRRQRFWTGADSPADTLCTQWTKGHSMRPRLRQRSPARNKKRARRWTGPLLVVRPTFDVRCRGSSRTARSSR